MSSALFLPSGQVGETCPALCWCPGLMAMGAFSPCQPCCPQIAHVSHACSPPTRRPSWPLDSSWTPSAWVGPNTYINTLTHSQSRISHTETYNECVFILTHMLTGTDMVCMNMDNHMDKFTCTHTSYTVWWLFIAIFIISMKNRHIADFIPIISTRRDCSRHRMFSGSGNKCFLILNAVGIWLKVDSYCHHLAQRFRTAILPNEVHAKLTHTLLPCVSSSLTFCCRSRGSWEGVVPWENLWSSRWDGVAAWMLPLLSWLHVMVICPRVIFLWNLCARIVCGGCIVGALIPKIMLLLFQRTLVPRTTGDTSQHVCSFSILSNSSATGDSCNHNLTLKQTLNQSSYQKWKH